MYSEKNKTFLRRIKFLIFILLFLFIPFYLDEYLLPEFHPDLSSLVPFEETPIEEAKVEEVKPVSPPKQKEIEEQPIARIETLPLPLSPIQAFSPAEEIDIFRIAQEIRNLRDRLSPGYEAKKFYIPPVEYKIKIKDLLIPAGMVTLGALASHTKDYRDFIPGVRSNPRNRETPFDDKAQLAVSPALFIFDVLGTEKHHPIDQFFLMAVSYGLTALPVRTIKNNYSASRPYGGNNSFPSGHTAVAFVGAHIIYKEFKDSNPWIAYSGYAMASVTAGARVIHDKHWVCDVVAGAGIAMLATELAYFIYFPVRNLLTNEINKLTDKYIILVPVVNPQTVGLHLSFRF